jgi:hypothetical protein
MPGPDPIASCRVPNEPSTSTGPSAIDELFRNSTPRKTVMRRISWRATLRTLRTRRVPSAPRAPSGTPRATRISRALWAYYASMRPIGPTTSPSSCRPGSCRLRGVGGSLDSHPRCPGHWGPSCGRCSHRELFRFPAGHFRSGPDRTRCRMLFTNCRAEDRGWRDNGRPCIDDER